MNEKEKIITKYWSERRSIDEEMKEFWLKVPPRMTLDEYLKPFRDEFNMFMKRLRVLEYLTHRKLRKFYPPFRPLSDEEDEHFKEFERRHSLELKNLKEDMLSAFDKIN